MMRGTESVWVFGSMLLAGACGLVLAGRPAHALNNGLAKTPPMGWSSWNTLGCGSNMNDAKIRAIADAMVSSGMKTAGYQYINLDDCWQAATRDQKGNVVPDPNFTHDMPGLVKYIHGRGLKFGLYSDRGTATCAGRVGSYGHESQDAKTYAAWGVDYLKYDNCAPVGDEQTVFQSMRDALKTSAPKITFSICTGYFRDWMPATGNLWRTYGDIGPSFASMADIINVNGRLARYAGPGGWNDPDMMEIGNGMGDTSDRAQMSMWAIMAAPLIAGNDLTTMSASTKAILTNVDVIAVDQDSLGAQGVLVQDNGDVQIWAKRLGQAGSRAVVALNRNPTTSASINVPWQAFGLKPGSGISKNLWRGATYTPNYSWVDTVPAQGVSMIKISSAVDQAATPIVTISNTDTRTITDLVVTVDFQIDGAAHTDYESVGTFDKTINLDLDGWNGAWNGSQVVGDFLYTQLGATGSKVLTIHKVDGRTITNLRISVNFNIDGLPHYDFEDIGNFFSVSTALVLNGNGGWWDGTKYLGDFLHH